MSNHPINLTVRFLLELIALVALGLWGWQQGQGLSRWFLALGLPLAAALLWGTFNIPEDPSRSGKAPIPVPGYIRLLLELSLFATATWMLADAGWQRAAILFGTITTIHYIASYDRVLWMLGIS